MFVAASSAPFTRVQRRVAQPIIAINHAPPTPVLSVVVAWLPTWCRTCCSCLTGSLNHELFWFCLIEGRGPIPVCAILLMLHTVPYLLMVLHPSPPFCRHLYGVRETLGTQLFSFERNTSAILLRSSIFVVLGRRQSESFMFRETTTPPRQNQE